MKNLDSIQALLEALKQAEAKGGLPGDDDEGQPIAAKLSVIKAKPLDGDDQGMADDMNDLVSGMGSDDDQDQNSDQDSRQDQYNAQMVDMLQDQYPQIYAKLDKALKLDPSYQSPDQSPDGSPVTKPPVKVLLASVTEPVAVIGDQVLGTCAICGNEQVTHDGWHRLEAVC
jgi:hypothetical protein